METLAHKLFCFITLLMSMAAFPSSLCLLPSTTSNHSIDQEALLALKSYIISDPSNAISDTWSPSTAFCGWVGVSCSCNPSSPRVTALSFPGKGLKGTLPPQIGNLSFLMFLDLSYNGFTGILPPELARLRRLKQLDLMMNNFSGAIPQALGCLPRLQRLYLWGNMLTGTVPESIFNISSLVRLNISENGLSGGLPSDVCRRLGRLEELELSFNYLSGEIPPSLHHCKVLRILGLSNNMFSGKIPKELGDLTMLRELYLGSNTLKSGIPEELGNLHRLVRLAAENNGLEGTIPIAVFNISSLKDIIVANNSLSGNLPMDLCARLPELEKLFLFGNHLIGSLPRDLGNCSMLKEIRLGQNNFTGTIPKEIVNLRNLEVLKIETNKLAGPIPHGIFNNTKMRDISFSINHLSGNLPSTLGLWLPRLKGLYLGGNSLSGTIPNSIANASNLLYLELGYNLFTGFVPGSLGNLENLLLLDLQSNILTEDRSFPQLRFLSSLSNCKNLKTLDIGENPLKGMFPPELNLSNSLERFDAYESKIFGKIPRGFGNLTSLIQLFLSNNNLVGPIPETLGKLVNLQQLDIDANEFNGSIPSEFCRLSSLGELNLSNNSFSGNIPTCLQNMTLLQTLYLNSNNLSSSIPQSLWSSLQNLLYLDLSSNSLSGNLSSEISNLNVIIEINMSNNRLSGNLPDGSFLRLTGLYLAHNSFSGPIPDSFGKLISLEKLDLTENNLSGSIPKSMEVLSHLVYLNLSYNELHGEIPSRGPFGNFTAESFLGDKGLCGPPRLQVPLCKSNSTTDSKTRKLIKYIVPTLASIAVFAIFFALTIRYCRRTKKLTTQNDSAQDLATWRRVSYIELDRATQGFNERNLLGFGGFGSVYKGSLLDGTVFAVKVIDSRLEGAFRSFHVECEALRNIRHRNLIRIISSCSDKSGFKALILEYMPNGSLENWLHDMDRGLDILQRLGIVMDAASAMEYLHHGCSTPIVHSDLKPSNVLLDENFVAHVSDFGLAKLLGGDNSMTQTNTLATIGYMAPEYGAEGIVSKRGDVYSFGILLIETFTGKKPIDDMFVGELTMTRWVSNLLPNSVVEIADTRLWNNEENFEEKRECLLSIMELALCCSKDSPEERIDMVHALATLRKIKINYQKRIEETRTTTRRY